MVAQVAVDGKPARTVHEGTIGAGWTDALVNLGAAGGQAARIDLIARGTKGDLAFGEPRVVVKSPAPPAAATPQPKFDHIFVWMVDTLRADKLHAYNTKTRVTTPNYEAFAADATRFEWAQVPGTWSLPSHASLLTGVYPTVHRATAHEAKLSKDVPFVAEELKKAGFKTAMFSSNGYVSGKWGFDRGWDVNRNFIRESLPNGSEYLWKTAKAWLTPIARQEAVRVPRDDRAARRVHAAARSSWSSTGTRRTSGRSSPCSRACSWASSRPASSRSTTTTRSTWKRCTTRDHPERRRVRRLHRRPQEDGHLRDVSRGGRVRSRRPVLRARQRRSRRHRVPGAGARAPDDPRARRLPRRARSCTPTSR